jgi:hypothetical protein
VEHESTSLRIQILKAFGFICHVEHYKMICNMIGIMLMTGQESGESVTA